MQSDCLWFLLVNDTRPAMILTTHLWWLTYIRISPKLFEKRQLSISWPHLRSSKFLFEVAIIVHWICIKMRDSSEQWKCTPIHGFMARNPKRESASQPLLTHNKGGKKKKEIVNDKKKRIKLYSHQNWK